MSKSTRPLPWLHGYQVHVWVGLRAFDMELPSSGFCAHLAFKLMHSYAAPRVQQTDRPGMIHPSTAQVFPMEGRSTHAGMLSE